MCQSTSTFTPGPRCPAQRCRRPIRMSRKMRSDRQSIEEQLGPLDAQRAGSISHLNAVPDSIIESARRLQDPTLARSLLAFYVTADARPYLDLFVQEVVFGTTPAATWLR